MWQVREYMFQLEGHLAEAHRQAQRLIRQQGSLGASLAEFGASMVGLGKFEQGAVADGFLNLGEKAESLARSSQVGGGTTPRMSHAHSSVGHGCHEQRQPGCTGSGIHKGPDGHFMI